MQEFNKYKFINGLPIEGQKVVFTTPCEHHWFRNVIEDQSLLSVGETYTVKRIEVASSATYLWLEEFPVDESWGRPFFNMHSFSWDIPLYSDEYMIDNIIGMNISDVIMVADTYRFGLVADGVLKIDKFPRLVIKTVPDPYRFESITEAFIEDEK